MLSFGKFEKISFFWWHRHYINLLSEKTWDSAIHNIGSGIQTKGSICNQRS